MIFAINDVEAYIDLSSVAESVDQLEEKLKASQEDKKYAEGQEAAAQRVLT